MALLRLVPAGSKVLRTVCLPFSPSEMTSPITKNLLLSLQASVLNEKALGAALPQFGIPKRAFAFKTSGSGEIHVAVNPKITRIETSMGSERDWEGCLSLPGSLALVERHRRVWVEYSRPGGANPVREILSGLGARVFQHELDHLDGVLMTDRALELRKES